ncbi:LRR receptor-like serine/threonine-protein kinase FLS2 isoform X2 [Ipomoea triloba]|uniref:LRR receptor-like serine/threonine-protein kinase FLS2 isoform X2 n=1 Tax=Ipomoea triloba TaxID=35885 RepID=UPI00125E6291|nr:LRR receptor-like serine/threonine-protein kinase FLS2 isoform X2 [Ipomoea triloba]
MTKLCFSFFSMVLLLLFCVIIASSGMNISTDESSLLALKSSIINMHSHPIILANWSNASSVCDWIGVTCGTRILRVIALDISQMGLSGTIPSQFGNLSFLVSLNASGNNFSGNLPDSLSHLHRLKIFDFNVNNLTGEISSWFGFLSNLQVLNLGQNHFTGSIPLSLFNLSKLETLDLSFNQVNGSIPSTIFNLSTLENLRLVSNSLSGTLPQNLCLHLKNIRKFEVTDNHLSGEMPKGLSMCFKLRCLGLNYNQFEGTIPQAFGNLTSLEFFRVGGNNLRGRVPKEIGYLHNLKELHTENNHITGFLPPHMFNMSSLQLLDMNTNNISGRIPREMSNLHKLEEVYLQINSFSGSIPWDIFNISTLLQLNLGLNSLSGYIPTTIGGLQQLVTISLENNLLQGPIPDSFANIISLEWLDLSNNNLTRRIPKSLETLRYLRFLNVSCNRLSGEIPSKGPFSNFSYQSFLCNEELCGSPRLKVPPCNADFSSPLSTRIILWIAFISMMAAFVVGVSLYILIKWKCKRPYNNEAYSVGEVVLTRISYYELQRATQGFDNRNLIGTGSFGSVYKGRFTYGLLLAVKVFNLQVEGAFKSFDTECKVLCNVRHRNLTKVITACSNADFKVLILRYMPNGSLDNWLYSNEQSLDIMQRLNIMIDVACALEYLHHDCAISIVHCDLKPSNVLIDDDMVGHVSDFGISKLLGHDESIVYTMTLAAIGYIAPEYGSSGMVSTKADIYSYGIMLMEVFTKRKPNDEMFEGDLTLKRWVSNSLSNNLDEILDPTLLKHEKLQFRQNMQCISSILELALDCTIESPNERMDIGGVLAKLNKTRHQFLTIF